MSVSTAALAPHSPSGASRQLGRLGRLAVVLLPAAAVNLLLFHLMQWLVDPQEQRISRLEDLRMVEFVRLQPEDEPPPEQRRRELPRRPPPPEKPPEPPPPETQPLERPVQPPLEMPLPEIDLPLRITGGPQLGDYKPNVVERVETPVVAPAAVEAPVAAAPAVPAYDANAVPVYRVPPSYPARAQRAGIEGHVVVELTIGPDGAVTEAVVVESSPPKVFDESALKAARKWRFEPKKADGQGISWKARQTISFKLQK